MRLHVALRGRPSEPSTCATLPRLWHSISPHSTPRSGYAVETVDGPLLVLAGAGSGKTRVLTYRIAHLVGDLRVSPAEILAITFTNKAAAEMRERLGELCGPSVRSMWVLTFHAMCVRMLRADGDRLGFTRNFTIYDQDDSKRLLKEVMRELEIDDKHYPVNGVANRISSAKSELLSSSDFAAKAVAPMDKKAAQIMARYQARLLAANAMDFDDLLGNAHRLLSQHEDVRRAYQQRFRYISVDEYQDTNHAQYAITNLLASGHGNLMVVGDDDQSIYSWRGADITNILEFERDYPQAVVVKLEENYRSTARILAAANAVVANNESRKPKTLFTANAEGEKISSYLASDERDEARFIAGEIERLVRAERPRLPGLRRLLPHQRAVAFAGRRAAARGRAVPDRRRHPLLRPRRDPRRHGLPQGRREPRRRDLAQAHHQHPQAQHRRNDRRAHRPRCAQQRDRVRGRVAPRGLRRSLPGAHAGGARRASSA